MRTLVFVASMMVTGCVGQMVTATQPDGTVVKTPASVVLNETIVAGQQKCYDNQLALAQVELGNRPESLTGTDYALAQMASAIATLAEVIKPQANPCSATNMADVQLAKENRYTILGTSLLDNSFGLVTAIVPWKYGAKVLTSAFDAAGDAYEIGDISQSTTFASEGGAGGAGGEGGLGGEAGGENGVAGSGAEGSEGGAAAAGGGAAGNNLVIGRGNAAGIAGADAQTSTGFKSGNGTIDDRDGVNESDVNASVDLSVPVGVN